jgi:tetratricopeptide (TPR) repeat protein
MSKRQSKPASPTAAAGGAKSDSRFATTMKWIGAVTAALTLLFAIQRVVTSVSDAKQKRARSTELLRVAAMQQRDGHYEEAWSTLRDAEALNTKQADVRAAEEDLAMEWLRNAQIAVGKETFADIVHKAQPILVRGLTSATEAKRRADLTAHVGWGDFLLWKDSGGEHPEEQYRRAIEVDSLNPYAHTMWGHWILYRHGSIDSARAHFAAAIRSGTHRDFVRDLQVRAISNLHDDTGEREILRLANEMRHSGESVSPEFRQRMADVVCFESSRSRSTRAPQPAIQTGTEPDEDLLAARWLFDGLSLGEGRDVTRDYCMATFEEAAGHAQQALATYTSVARRLPKYSALETGTKAAIRRLTGPSTR